MAKPSIHAGFRGFNKILRNVGNKQRNAGNPRRYSLSEQLDIKKYKIYKEG